MKVIDYALAMNNNLELMLKNVDEHIAKGYEPVGGVVIDERYDGKYYIQTMVKYKQPGRPKLNLFGSREEC